MYEHAPVPVPPEVTAAHERRLRALARPGTWLTAEQRLEIALEVRGASSCQLCGQRRDVVSPAMIDGEHDRRTAAPDPVLDASHRVVVDPHRLTEAWFKALLHDGVDVVEYVELVGVVANVVALDTFAHALGLEQLPLPVAEPGDPSREFPDGLTTTTAWVPTVLPENAKGEIADFYAPFEVGNIVVALSMIPAELFGFWELVDSMYLPGENFPDLGYAGTLSRVQREVLAAQVSMLNQCFYCSSVHTLLLEASSGHAGVGVTMPALVDDARADGIGVANGPELIAFARAVHDGAAAQITEAREKLQAAAGPEAVGDAAAVVALFMAINRVANATGTRLDDRFEAATSDLRSTLRIDGFPTNGAV